jgi:hypothetical protein
MPCLAGPGSLQTPYGCSEDGVGLHDDPQSTLDPRPSGSPPGNGRLQGTASHARQRWFGTGGSTFTPALPWPAAGATDHIVRAVALFRGRER